MMGVKGNESWYQVKSEINALTCQCNSDISNTTLYSLEVVNGNAGVITFPNTLPK
jgi:hypothetical protein